MTHGEIWTIDFGIPVGSLPSKIRPAVVMQNDLLDTKPPAPPAAPSPDMGGMYTKKTGSLAVETLFFCF